MDPGATPSAPPVVAVVVASEPGPWLGEALSALARQDYPELSVLFVDAGSTTDPSPRIGAVLPGATIRRLGGGRGFAAAANEALSRVRGASYVLFCHDDVAPDPDATRQLVEEALRSNAGVVGPKLVQWDHPDRLLQVGAAADKTGYVVPLVDPGELDQEQHDAVRDVFAVPSACMLVRHDLFVAIGGFDEEMGATFSDVDLCWRAQVAGARVLVAPSARVRHLGAGSEREVTRAGWRRRRGGLPGAAPGVGGDGPRSHAERVGMLARYRLRSTLKNYGWFHLLRVLPQAAAGSVAEAIVALTAGRFGEARGIAAAWPWNLRRLGLLRPLRRAVQASRLVPDGEVRRQQVRGSAHLTAFLRGQLHAEARAQHLAEAGRSLAGSLRTRGGRNVALGWTAIVVVLLAGTRHLLSGRVPAVGQLVPYPSVSTLFGHATSGWRTTGLGSDGPAPVAFSLLGLAGTVLFGAMGVLQKLLVLGAWPLAIVGMWRLSRPLRSRGARLAAVAVYVSIPLPYNALARGRWSGLVAYAVAPWLLARLARATRLDPFAEGPAPSLRRELVGLSITLALAAALAPGLVLVVVVVALALALGSVLVGGVGGGLRAVGVAVAGAVGAALLLLPWSLDFVLPGREWSLVGGVGQPPAHAAGLGTLLRFQTGPLGAPPLGWAFLVAAALPLLVGRGWRLAWAVRLWIVALACIGVAWALGRGWFSVGTDRAELLMAPAAASLAGAVALGAAAFEVDLRRYRFGWRQVASVIAAGAVAIGTLPILGAAWGGRWHVPSTDLASSLSWMPGKAQAGGFRVLWVGDPAVLPLDGWRLQDGLAYGTSRDGPPDVTDLWPGPSSGASRLIADGLVLARRGDTTRLGHVLAPMAIRYVVLTEQAAPARARGQRGVIPLDLLTAMAAQIDFRLVPTDPAVVVYENTAWGPTRAAVTAATADPTSLDAQRKGLDLSGAPALFRQGWSAVRFTGRVPASTDCVLLSEAFSPHWKLTVGGRPVPAVKAFGWGTAFPVNQCGPSGGSASSASGSIPARLAFSPPLASRGGLVAEVVLWLAALETLRRTGPRRLRRRAAGPEPEPPPGERPWASVASGGEGADARGTPTRVASTAGTVAVARPTRMETGR